MAEFEYLTVRLAQDIRAQERSLNALGQHRWELVAMVGSLAYLKRRRLASAASLLGLSESSPPSPKPRAPSKLPTHLRLAAVRAED
jgi:hypothetical protein